MSITSLKYYDVLDKWHEEKNKKEIRESERNDLTSSL